MELNKTESGDFIIICSDLELRDIAIGLGDITYSKWLKGNSSFLPIDADDENSTKTSYVKNYYLIRSVIGNNWLTPEGIKQRDRDGTD